MGAGASVGAEGGELGVEVRLVDFHGAEAARKRLVGRVAERVVHGLRTTRRPGHGRKIRSIRNVK